MQRSAPGILAVAIVLAACSSSQAATTPSPVTQGQQRSDDTVKAYDEVITDAAISDDGLFLLHTVGGTLYYEIPDSLMGRDMLLISRIAQTPANMSGFINAGSKVAEQVVVWERRNGQVMLRKISYNNVAADTLPVYQSVQSNNFAPIIAAFDIEAFGSDSTTVVIDVTDFFETDVPAISGLSRQQRTRFGVRRLDPDRSFIDRSGSYPLNVEVRHTLTFEATEPPSDANTGTISMQMHQTMVLLPKEPMRPRHSDPRVGFITITQVNFGLDEQKAATQSFIKRWRLEPSDPAAYARGELVEPVKPIVYYLDPATPKMWRPYFRAGIEDWQVAFEAAGFKNAILARDAPTPEEDPDFSPEDVRYSTVRYVANMTRNAVGPSVADPRSGEIIESDIIWYHNHMRSYRNRLMIETGAANPAARQLKLDTALMGMAMQAVISHEIGHALGLPHNLGASWAYPVDSLRSPTFTEAMGVAPTIMDYARQNYIAQPGDGVTRFIRKIGPYDKYAINWGYRVIPDAPTADGEKATLDGWILEHAHDPMYRFGAGSNDPRTQTEDIGDDAVRASTFGIMNLQKVLPNLVEWTSTDGKDYTDLNELYGELLGQWNRYVGHVLTNVGGVYHTIKTSDQDGPVFEPVPRAKQREAVQFLIDQVFITPTWLHDEDLLRRIESVCAVDRLRRMQVARLNQLLDPRRMQRLIEGEVFRPGRAYALLEFMTDLKQGVWSELDGRAAIDTYRRNLQRGYIERLAYLMNEEPAAPGNNPFARAALTSVDVSQSDIRPLVRAQLRDLRAEAERAAQRTGDQVTRYHLEDIVVRIDAILEGEDPRDM
ncbi:MAG: zinc-dependent metalloprotease [Gemmatimonadetes bacterium]|nr:zinc-dependent metalloprotease [Gemmatimonadota bacterium]